MNPAEVPVILNPSSGTGEARRAAKKIAEAFRSSGLEPKIIMVNREITRAAAMSVKDGQPTPEPRC
jgi:diacylglycerol kinase family enzyme